MNINTDLTKYVAVRSEEMAWVPSPSPGVERRMLSRRGGERAVATSIVRYAPGTRFDEHRHPFGEEYLVLEGTFSDNHGDYPAGTYVRNPWDSAHAPFSEQGCTILVMLCQMHPEDDARVVVDTSQAVWHPSDTPGVEVLELHAFGEERVQLERWSPGAHIARHEHPAGEELLVLEGELEDERGVYPSGAWVRWPRGSAHSPRSERGCVLWVKRGAPALDLEVLREEGVAV